MLSLMAVFMGGVVVGAGKTRRTKAKAPATEVKQEANETSLTNKQDATVPDGSPSGSSLSRHNFLYAGQSKQRRMFIVKDGEVSWSYQDDLKRGEISDAVLLTDGHILVAHQYGVAEVTQDGQNGAMRPPKALRYTPCSPSARATWCLCRTANPPRLW